MFEIYPYTIFEMLIVPVKLKCITFGLRARLDWVPNLLCHSFVGVSLLHWSHD